MVIKRSTVHSGVEKLFEVAYVIFFVSSKEWIPNSTCWLLTHFLSLYGKILYKQFVICLIKTEPNFTVNWKRKEMKAFFFFILDLWKFQAKNFFLSKKKKNCARNVGRIKHNTLIVKENIQLFKCEFKMASNPLCGAICLMFMGVSMTHA